MKSLMTLLKLNDLAFERQKNDILVKGIEKIKQVLGQGGILFTYEKWDLVGTFYGDQIENGIFKARMCDKECLYLSCIARADWCDCYLM